MAIPTHARPGLEESPPNVVLILADDLGYSGLHDWGSEFLETPHIDAIGAAGMRFTNGLAAYPVCKPTRAALLTGQYGARTGVHRVADRHAGREDRIRFRVPENQNLSPGAVTLAEVFRENGYTTAMFGKWHVSDNREGHPLHHGFDRAIVSQATHFDFETWPQTAVPDADMSAGEFMTEQALQFMVDAVAKRRPFFLYMPYFLVHKPLQSRPGDIAHFEQKLAGSGDAELPMVAAMTRDLDRLVGRLDAQLEKLGVFEDTVVVFTSDNGAYNENLVGGLRGRKGQVYEGGMRVPYYFRYPGRIPAGAVRSDRIITVDLFPTLLDLAGIRPPPDLTLDGASLRALLRGEQAALPERPLICFFPKYAQYRENTGRWRDSWRNVLYRGDYKYIEYPEYGSAELFNLAHNPKEDRNLAPEEPGRLAQMKNELAAILAGMDVPDPEPNPNYVPGTSTTKQR
jgi:arylsulfatase A-like enzyme